jgi:hypothetical protein
VAKFQTDDSQAPIRLVARCFFTGFRDVVAEVVISDLPGGPVTAFGQISVDNHLVLGDFNNFSLDVFLTTGEALLFFPDATQTGEATVKFFEHP